MKEKFKKFREMTNKELSDEIAKRKEELFNLRFQHITGQLENPMKLREIRREVAVLKTITKEKMAKNEKIATQVK